MSEKPSSCLIANNAQIPLQGVRIDARVSDLCSEVTITQRYHNAEATDVEAVYTFPMEEGSAVCGFEAKVGDRVIRGRAEEREKAFEIYDDAMAAGHGAMLLDQERPNVFTASVGNLKPNQTIEVSIRYVTLLNFEGSAIRLMIPTTVSPRYIPAQAPQVGQPDAERISPETREAVPYGLTLNVEVECSSPVQELDSPSHPVRIGLREKGATVSLSTGETALDRDFVLLVKPRDAHQPSARIAREADGTKVAMVTFHPNPEGLPNPGNEVLFLLDCSGSMGGDSIEQAKRALALCVRALSEIDTFNIVRFGSGFQSLWPTAQAYNQANLEAATAHIQSIQADLGGTEILAPLQHLLDLAQDGKRSRQILLLTDGEVGNEADVIDLCKKRADVARVFTFGIGAGASEHLVRGVARASRGAAEFIYPGERIEPKVLRMFNRVNTPSLKKVTVDWRGLDVEQAPAECPAVFGGDSLTVFARIQSGTADKIVLHADELSWELPLDLEQTEPGGAVPILWARQAIRDLESAHGAPARGSNQARANKEDRKRAKIVELGVRYGLMSSATSYVAVEVRSEADKTQGQAELRKVPVALTKGWGGKGSVMPGVPMPKPAAAPSSTLVGGVARAGGGFINYSMPSPGGPAPASPPPMPRRAAMPGAPPPPAQQAPMAAFDDMPMELEEASRSIDDLECADEDTGAFFAPMAEAPEPSPDGVLQDHLDKNTIVRGVASESKKKADAPEKDAKGGLLSRLFGKSKKAEAAKPSPKAAARPANVPAPPPPPPPPASMPAMMQPPVGAASAPRREKEEASDRLFDLLMTQQANGSFRMSPSLRQWLGARVAAVEELARREGEELVFTAVVLELLRKEEAGRQDEWAPAAAKATRWLANQSKKVDVSGVV